MRLRTEFRHMPAARVGHIELLKWAVSHGCSLETLISGSLDCLKCANGCEWTTNAGAVAAWNGHLHMLTWTRESAFSVRAFNFNASSTCSVAAAAGQLAILKWDANACTMAISNGHLPVLKWARANGCPLDDNTASCEWTAVTCAHCDWNDEKINSLTFIEPSLKKFSCERCFKR